MSLHTVVLSHLRPPHLLSPQNGLLFTLLLLFLLLALPVTAKPASQSTTFTPQAVDAGINHTCARSNEGGVKCWGRNNVGQVGDNSRFDRLQPVDVSGLSSGVSGVGSGEEFTCAILTGGAIRCWGKNTEGELGNGSQTPSNLPVVVSNITSGATALALGTNHACAIVNGGVQCWGNNERSQLGNNSVSRSTVPMSVAGLSSGVTAIGAGTQHTCALVNGKVQCWGRNDYGQVGNGFKVDQVTPVDVVDLGATVIGLAVGDHHNCALLQGGGVKCWGRNIEGRVGNGTVIEQPRPVDVSGLTSGVVAIGAGGRHSCAVIGSDGSVRCWGFNGQGQLGNNSLGDSTVPVNVLTLNSIQSVTLGDNHTCALGSNRSVFCWGDNQFGQLGNNSQSNASSPAQVTGFGTATPVPTTPPPTTPPPTTPPPTTPPPTTVARPDLTVTGMVVELETGGSCSYSSTQLGVRVTVRNIGNAAAGPFVVAISNGQSKTVSEGLAIGASTTVWLPGGGETATVDSTALVQESNETNNSLTQFLPTPTLPATCTPTTTPPPSPTTPVATTPAPRGVSQLYLPAIARAPPTPTPTFTPTLTPIVTRSWRQIAGDNLTVAKIVIEGATLFVGTRGEANDSTRGLYRGSIAACPNTIALDPVAAIPSGSLLDIVFQGQSGVAVSHDSGVYYTSNNGGTWAKSTTDMLNPRTVTIVNNRYYVGTQATGIYISSNQGVTWPTKITDDKLININVLQFDSQTTNNVLLWIGTDKEGVFTLNTQTDRLVSYNDGLTGAAKEIWSFTFDTLNIYAGTSAGVFFTSNNAAWQPFGLFSGKTAEIGSLIIQDSHLIAGTRGAGIWRRPLNGSRDWEAIWDATLIVRALILDNTHCGGILAATNDGVWLYR